MGKKSLKRRSGVASQDSSVVSSETITHASLEKGHSEDMVMTPDAHSSSGMLKSLLQKESGNIYRSHARGEEIQSRVVSRHSGSIGLCEIGNGSDGGRKSNDDRIKVINEHVNLRGPVCVDSLSKEGSRKKEDKWLLKPSNTWSLKSAADEHSTNAHFGAWGVFDGHGGRQVATYASHSLIKFVAEYCGHPLASNELDELHPSSDDCESDDILCSPRVLDDSSQRIDAVEHILQNEPAVDEWSAQCEFMKRLPIAVRRAFLKCDEMACKQFAHGGTTGTVAFLCGWQLLVANVGDSCAYLDTGSEVLAVSGNHRLEDNQSEVVRIEQSGGEVAPSSIDGKPAGPIRVWPGGLAMSRTIGDVDAGDLCLAEPEITQVTIPKDGARLFIASDGLWDAVHPKTASHHTRDMTASEASHKLLSMAIKKDHLKDDVTIIVVDFLPSEDFKIPPGLSLHKPVKGKHVAQVEKLASVWHPLTSSKNHKWIEEELERRVETYCSWKAKLEEEKLLSQRQEEIKKKHAVTQEPSSLLEELSNLTLSPDDFGDADDDAGEWETVQPVHPTQQANITAKGNKSGSNSKKKQKAKKPKNNKQKENTVDSGVVKETKSEPHSNTDTKRQHWRKKGKPNVRQEGNTKKGEGDRVVHQTPQIDINIDDKVKMKPKRRFYSKKNNKNPGTQEKKN
jgi:serine/threonine protein phosphatase PrpC